MAYTPELSRQGSATLRRLAWFQGRPMTRTLERIVIESAETSARSDPGAVCLKCRDNSRCDSCVFGSQSRQANKPKEVMRWTETQNNRMESFSFHSKITCDRCGKEKPEGREGLGWFSSKAHARSGVGFTLCSDYGGKQTDICFDCLMKEEFEGAARQLAQHIYQVIWRNGSLIGRRIRAIEADQEALEKDCEKIRQLLAVLNPTNQKSLLDKVNRTAASAGIVPWRAGIGNNCLETQIKQVERRTS
jgi:hypothetical protein